MSSAPLSGSGLSSSCLGASAGSLSNAAGALGSATASYVGAYNPFGSSTTAQGYPYYSSAAYNSAAFGTGNAAQNYASQQVKF